MRTIATRLGAVVDVQHRASAGGRAPLIAHLVIDGATTELTRDDCARIGAALTAAALGMRHMHSADASEEIDTAAEAREVDALVRAEVGS